MVFFMSDQQPQFEVIGDGVLPDAATEALARLLLDVVEQEERGGGSSGDGDDIDRDRLRRGTTTTAAADVARPGTS